MIPTLTDSDYAAIAKRYEDAGDVRNADIIRRQRDAARASGWEEEREPSDPTGLAARGWPPARGVPVRPGALRRPGDAGPRVGAGCGQGATASPYTPPFGCPAWWSPGPSSPAGGAE